MKTSTISQPWNVKVAIEACAPWIRSWASRSIGFVQKCGGSGTVLPRHSTTRVRISVIFMQVSGRGRERHGDGPHDGNGQADDGEGEDVERAGDGEDDAVAEAASSRRPTTWPNTTPPIAPPKPTRPATAPTALRGNRSVGRIITSVDHDCWPKKARLKIAIAQRDRRVRHEPERPASRRRSGRARSCGRDRAAGRASAGSSRTSRRAGSRRRRRRSGIQAKAPTALMSKPRAS